MSGNICRFFRLGNCLAGENCRFSHEEFTTTNSNSSSICRFFLNGSCSYGDECRFTHEQQQPEMTQDNFPSISSPGTTWTHVENIPEFKSLQISTGEAESKPKTNWADAAPFVPSKKSWAQIAKPKANDLGLVIQEEIPLEDAESQLCPFGVTGVCRYGDQCAYFHGEMCDLCFEYCLHPTHQGQRKEHKRKCLLQHEKEMEMAFAVAKSKDKTCGICMETVMDKVKGEARFGILPNCNHCFCLPCLRKWRQASFENKIIRACPECRQTSDYICPSRFWVDTKAEKEKLFTDYRHALNDKECKYFNKGDGECPFGNKCFYKHRDVNGEEVDVGPPQGRRRRQDANGELTFAERLFINEFLEEREARFEEYPDVPLEMLEILEMLSEESDIEHEMAMFDASLGH